MVQNESIYKSEDYVNYTFHISSKGAGTVAGELLGLSNTVSTLLGDIAFKTSEMLSYTETLAMGTSVAIGAMFVSATKDAVRFEQQMANVKAIGGESLNIKEIGNAAMEYSNKFGMATSSMTEGLEALARAGITTTSVMKSVLEEGVKLSKLEGMSLEDSINDLISTTNLLALNDVDMNDAQYAEMVKVMNQHIVSTSESAPINAQNIIQTLQHVGGYASASGIDQDDLFAVIAQLGSRGTKGEMAGTALRAFIAAGQKDTAQRALARIGLNVTDLWNDNGETMLSISEMKDVLDEALEARGYSKQEKLEFYSDFAGYKQANQIMKINTSEVAKYKDQIANAWDLGTKLNTILNTVRGNLDRILQITTNFMTKVGSKFLFIANTILTPVRMVLELLNKMPFADSAVAIGMVLLGFKGILVIINNIVPRFSGFFIQLSQAKHDMGDIRDVWRKLPDDISRAKKNLHDAFFNPASLLQTQQDEQLFSIKEIQKIEKRTARLFFIEQNWSDPRLNGLTTKEKTNFLSEAYEQKGELYETNLINKLKINNPEAWNEAINQMIQNTITHSNNTAIGASYDIEGILEQDEDLLTSIDKYVALIWGVVSHNNNESPKSNRERNAEDRQARNQARQEVFRREGNRILQKKSQYGDYSYNVTVDGMNQFKYDDINEMRKFEEKVKEEIRRKQEMYASFLDDKSIEAGRNRLKKSLTIAAKTDLGYEFSTGANTSDIKHILETGHIRDGSSYILREQLQTIADALDTHATGNANADMQRFYNILKNKNNKDELLESILNKTQVQWNNKYYNNGRVGFFPTKALEMASGGETAQKIMERVGADSIEEVQRRFQNVQLDDALLNECVDIMYEDKELVEKLINEEIKYMYENLARVQNSILKVTNDGGDGGFRNEGEIFNKNLKKAREYVLSDFNPREFENFSASPRTPTANLEDIIKDQNADILYKYSPTKPLREHLEGFQGFIYPIGGDIMRSQRSGSDNFKIRNIKHIPYNDLLQENVEDVFLEREDSDSRYDFMTSFAEWVYEMASYDGNYWENTFSYYYARKNGFEDGEERFNELKKELEEIYRAYIDLAAYGAQELIESTKLAVPTVSYRGGRLYTPENYFGQFDTITSTSLIWDVAKNFWNKNPLDRTIMEIYNPEDNPGVIAHYDILNEANDHLWSRERELTLGKNQPYLHIPNTESAEKKLLMLTADQQKAVKEIMGDDFKFADNVRSSRFTVEDLIAIAKKVEEMEANGFYNAGESTGVSALRNTMPLMLNKDILTKDNLAMKLQDFFENGSIITGSKKYGQGFLGEADKGMIDIRPGVIKYYTDEDSETWGEYGNTLLDTVIHEMTHTLMMHEERQNYQKNNMSPELGIDNFEIPQQLLGYTKNFVAEYEAQYVSSEIFKRLGLEVSQKNQQRLNAFENLIKHKGYEDQIQYELLDQLVEDMLANISTIGDITEVLSTQWDMTEAGITSAQISEDMRPILTKIQAFDKDAVLYQGPNANSKKDEIEQTLSDMEKDMELLWSSGILDKELIYHMVGQKYAPYIETLEDVNLGQFLKHASPKFKKVTPNFIAEMSLDNDVDKYVKDFVKSDLNDVLKPIIEEEKEKDPNKKLRKTLSGFKEVWIEGKGVLRLPIHSAPPVTNASGKYDQGYMNKFIFNRAKDATTGPLGIRNVLDSDPVQGLPMSQKVHIAKSILEEEQYQPASDLMSVDKKLSGAAGWFVINTDTGITCINRMTDGICEFADACYAAAGTIRPAGLKKQLAKMIMYYDNTPEELINEIQKRKGKVGRINQEGEFNSLEDFYKIKQIAELLPDVRFYGYTKNQDVLKEIIKNGLPDNLTINDSLGRTHGAQYMSVPQNEIIDFLEAGYLLCKGACATCEQCLNDIKKVTILRDGSQTLGVEDVAHLNLKGQKIVFQTLKDYEKAGVQVTRELTEELIADVSAIPGMMRKNNTGFRNEGGNYRLPELGDYFDYTDNTINRSFLKTIGYGSLDSNVQAFLDEIDDTFRISDEVRHDMGRRGLKDNHWAIRALLNDGWGKIGSQTERINNFGIYYNRKKTKDVKEGAFEEVINLFNTDATKEAFMQGTISTNQLKKWYKQLQKSQAVEDYGDVPWNLNDVDAWQKERDEADKKLATILEERRKKIQEELEAQNEIVIATLQILSLMSATETRPTPFGMPGLVESLAYINFKMEELTRIQELEDISNQTAEAYKDFYTKQQEHLEEIQQKQLDNQNQKFIIEENAKKNAESYSKFYEDEAKIIHDRNEAIWDSYTFINQFKDVIRGNNVSVGSNNTNKDTDDNEIDEDLIKTLETLYTKNVYDDMSKFEKAKYHLGKDGQSHKYIVSAIDLMERVYNKADKKMTGFTSQNNSEETQEYLNKISFAQEKIQNIEQPLKSFNDALSEAAQVLPILSPLVWGLNTALWGLNMVSTILGITETLLTVEKFKDTLVSWGLFTAEQAEAIAKGEVTMATWFLTEAIGVLEAIISGPLIVVIGAVIAAIATLKFWENQHAKALKESQEALKESITKNKIAYSQYQDFHKARQNETDAMKRQQLARKESIALYNLEASRIKNLNAINENSKLRGDGLWGEYGERARMQKTSWAGSIFAEGIPFLGTISKWLSGDFESQYEQYAGSTGEIRRIRESALTAPAMSPESAVAKWYDQHKIQLGQIEAFAPQLQELYDKESQLIDRYGSKEQARNSKEFKEAVQEFANATGINRETAQKYLDYLQTEANVENARKVMEAEVQGIVAEAEKNAMVALYGDETGMGDLNTVQDSMVFATANEIFKEAYQDLYWKMLMEWLAAIWSAITLNFGESQKHAKAAGAYQDGMHELMKNQQKITEDGFDAANADERKDYGNESYSTYDDSPFGGATESSQAMAKDWEAEQTYQSTNKHSNKKWAGNTIHTSLATQNKTFDKFASNYSDGNNNVQLDSSKTEIHIHNLNINTDDDPEKIKTAFMELMVELSEQVSPRTVSRTVGGGTNNTSTNTNNTNTTNDSNNNTNNNNPSGI